MALAYRGIFALLPFALLLVAALSFLRADMALLWLAEQGPPGLGGPLPELIRWLEEGVIGQTQGGLLAAGVALAFAVAASGALLGASLLGARYPRLVAWPLAAVGGAIGGLGLLRAAQRRSSE